MVRVRDIKWERGVGITQKAQDVSVRGAVYLVGLHENFFLLCSNYATASVFYHLPAVADGSCCIIELEYAGQPVDERDIACHDRPTKTSSITGNHNANSPLKPGAFSAVCSISR